jgi:transcriptional regulator with XRE-family HTH domain
MGDDIDVYIGKRLRRRRRILGMTQQQLAESIGVRFQQIQKYECGSNRITAAKLFKLACSLNVPTNYFFEGWKAGPEGVLEREASEHNQLAPDVLSQRETLELIRAYYQLGERPRRRLLDLAKALQEDVVVAVA